MRLATRVYLKYNLAKTLNMPLMNGCKPVTTLRTTQLIYSLYFNEVTSKISFGGVTNTQRRMFMDCLNQSLGWALKMKAEGALPRLKASPVTRGSDRV